MGGYRFGSYKTELVLGLWSLVLRPRCLSHNRTSKTKNLRPKTNCPLFPHRHCSIQIQIELQHVYSWFAQKAELSALRMPRYDLPQFFLIDAALASNSGHLKFSPGGRNVRVKS